MKRSFLIVALFIAFSFVSISQCTVMNDTGSCAIVPGLLIGQSFTANCDGTLQSVQFYSANTGTISGGTLNIYHASSPIGSPAYTQAYSSIDITNSNGPVLFNITGSFPIVNGNQYTFEFNSDNFPMLGGGSYIGGDAFIAGNNTGLDFLFDVEVTESLSEMELGLSEFQLYPNPSNGIVKIDTDKAFYLEVVNPSGTIILYLEGVNEVSLNKPGIYFFRFIDLNGSRVEKVVVN
ncbi:MAG: T9SS type A sorting domain-containing protein [Crocinitomicaceae bacterium]|nr:T9SS type A sorting domain-containing protein [Crocinitomicaceae bacterium]